MMANTLALPVRGQALGPAQDVAAILGALPGSVVVVDADERLRYANAAAEQLFAASAAQLVGQRLADLVLPDSPLLSLVAKVMALGSTVSEYGLTLETPRIGTRALDVHAAPLNDGRGGIVLSLHDHSIARKIDRQFTHRGAARSVTGMAAMLAHEVRNPLSGIRGAAQLLEQNASPEDRELTRLIWEETDRICALLDRMEVFSDGGPLERGAVNIHKVLEHVRRLAQSGFARHARIFERYDPSLPPVHGNRDQLVQMFLNLLKNAAEAVPPSGGEIVLTTSYQTGVRLGTVSGAGGRTHLPLVVSVQDNGSGIPEDLRAHLFDPFVTTKANGTGLGLALVAKIVDDHGGIVEFDSQPRRTVFRVLLPMAQGPANEEER
jgi:two-component system nitrogen regulation sensor histidine kinase GlnL